MVNRRVCIKIFLMGIMLFGSYQVFGIKYEGQIVKTNGDTIDCKIIFGDLSTYKFKDEILSKGKIKVQINNEKFNFTPSDLIYYSIKIKNNWQTYWSVKTENGILFMKKVSDGKLTLFSCMTYNFMTYTYTNHFLFLKKETTEKLYLRWGIIKNKKKILKYLEDCEVINQQIKSKKIKVGKLPHWKIIADTYNEHC